MTSNNRLLNAWEALTARLRGIGQLLPPLVMRCIMGWEFYESGLEKYYGENWFADIQDNFPFPFNSIPADLSWAMAIGLEIGGAALLIFGLFTRLAAYSLLVLTFVATAAVHWPNMIAMWGDLAKGYAITDMGYGNFKLPLLFVVLLLPLVFQGPGKLSLDYLLAQILKFNPMPEPVTDRYAWGLGLLALAIPFLFLIPIFGSILLAVSATVLMLGYFWP